MSNEGAILHADLDAFFASVEQRDNPELRGKPVIVSGGGVVLAASYEAKRLGVDSAMGMGPALRLCPVATVVPPRFPAYTQASRAVFEIFHETTPLVEGLSIDEAFLDVAGLRHLDLGPPSAIAARLRRTVWERVGLRITVGVARTKFLAKVASGVAKPDGLLVVPTDKELEFLHPLPVRRLWGVGPVTQAKLLRLGIRTVGEVAGVGEAALVSILGSAHGRHLHALAHGLDPRPVEVGRERGSIGAQHAMRTTTDAAEVDAMAVNLVDRVTRRLRESGRSGRTVVLRLRFGDYTKATRSHTLPAPTAHTPTVLRAVRDLLTGVQAEVAARGLTLVGVAVGNLAGEEAEQLELALDGAPERAQAPRELDSVLDAVRSKFGTAAVTRAVLLGRDTGFSMPTLND